MLGVLPMLGSTVSSTETAAMGGGTFKTFEGAGLNTGLHGDCVASGQGFGGDLSGTAPGKEVLAGIDSLSSIVSICDVKTVRLWET